MIENFGVNKRSSGMGRTNALPYAVHGSAVYCENGIFSAAEISSHSEVHSILTRKDKRRRRFAVRSNVSSVGSDAWHGKYCGSFNSIVNWRSGGGLLDVDKCVLWYDDGVCRERSGNILPQEAWKPLHRRCYAIYSDRSF